MRLLVALCIAAGLLFGQSPDRRTFSAEDKQLEHPIPVPDSIMTALAQDGDVIKLLSQGQKLPNSWFVGAETSLIENERDVVVIGAGPLLGTNVTTFWVFRPQDEGFQLVLKVTAHTIEAKNDRSHGFRNIEALSVAAAKMKVATFKFDGKKYEHSGTKTTSLR